MYCTNCGVELPAKSRFCVECGTQVVVEVETAVAQPRVRPSRRQWMLLGALALVATAVGGAYWYASRIATIKVDEFVADLEGKVGITYGDVSANPFSRSVTLRDLKITSIDGNPIDGVTVEPPRLSRRLHHLRGWSNGNTDEVFTGSTGAGGAPGAGAAA